MNQSLIFDLSLPELSSLLSQWNEPTYRAKQVWNGIYRNLWNDPNEFLNLPNPLRKKLSENLEFNPLLPIDTQKSKDGETVKTLFQLRDGQAVETVLMKYESPASFRQLNAGGSKRGRRTLCISTQVGCAMGCVFCATGQMGFKRHLSSGEIIAQVIHFARLLYNQDERVSNVVVMGMGEPFHNYDNTMAAIDRLNDSDGFNFGARRFTISTVGLIPSIIRFTREKRQVNLAISLHSATNSGRSSMLPINKKYSLEELMDSCHDYVATTKRRITFEWALIDGVNDTPQEAELLSNLLKDLLCHVNAIPLNPTKGYSGKVTSKKNAQIFKQILVNAGIPCTIRIRKGIDIDAGCGQLHYKKSV